MTLAPRIPDYMWLGGDEDGGVWLQCRHQQHDDTHQLSVAHHGGCTCGEDHADGLPHYKTLADFIDFIHAHVREHEETP